MNAAVILNQSSGSEKENQKFIEDSFRELNVNCKIYCVEGSELAGTAKKIVEKGIDILVAGGGDGTVSCIAGVLAGGKIPLGVLPCGTLNHFAKDIGMPMDLKEAIKVISEGKTEMLDIAEVNGRKFLNNSSIGIYPHIVKNREAEQKVNTRTKWSGLLYAMVRTFKRFPLFDIEIKLNGKLTKLKTPIVFAGNNKYILELFNVGKRERLDEGVLSIYMSTCKTRFCMLRLALRSLTNRMSSKDFEINYTTEALINTRRKNVHVSLDGEVVNMASPLSYKIIPKSLPVIVPRDK